MLWESQEGKGRNIMVESSQPKLGQAAVGGDHNACLDSRTNQENLRLGRPEEKPSFLGARGIWSTERRREMVAVD